MDTEPLLNEKETVRISKFLSLVLRHKPETIGIIPDENGWVDTDDLLLKLKEHNQGLSLQELKWVVENNNKKRFSLSADFKKIRANQGHSIDIDLGLRKATPPLHLFHGTAEKNIDSIKIQGLVKGKRHHVHLSSDYNTAKEVGMRYGKPVVLTVLSDQMYKDGFEFFLSENGVWLTEAVPPNYINFSSADSF